MVRQVATIAQTVAEYREKERKRRRANEESAAVLRLVEEEQTAIAAGKAFDWDARVKEVSK